MEFIIGFLIISIFADINLEVLALLSVITIDVQMQALKN